MRWFSQTISVIGLGLRSLPQRLGPSIVAVVGITGVVVTFVAVLSIAEGFNAAMSNAGSPDTAIVLRAGSNAELNSALPVEATRVITDAPGIRRGERGPMASPELFVIIDVPKKSSGTDANVPMRGVQASAFEVRPEVRIVEGRAFTPGTNEVVVGRGAAALFEGLEVGQTKRWGEATWSVVGVFEADGTVVESEIWSDAAVLQSSYRRGSTFQSVVARLDSAEAFQQFKDSLTTDPRLDVQVERETDYYSSQSAQVRAIITGIGTIIAVLMGIGAVFGAVNTMYNAVATRTREIATLRALGFRASSVVISVMMESALLAVVGGVIGGGVAYLVFHGFQTATMNWETFSQVTFTFTVTPALLVQGALYALVMGLVGGFFPAIRAARLPIVTALREL
ncbi:MAG: hypothetical protein CL441_09225 [Acidimicrobiaceae bacterium]|nr:hypothetical protein [Acidimicrobiaceae bacterium]